MRQISEADQIQCPNCGQYNRPRRVSSLNPRTRTGRPTSHSDPLGCLIAFGIWLPIVMLVTLTFWLLGLHPSGLLYDGVVELGAVIISILLAIPLYQALKRVLRRRALAYTYFRCDRCGKKWVVSNEPPAQEL